MADTRILVVEDEQSIRDLIAFGLRRVGCDVALAEHGRPGEERDEDDRREMRVSKPRGPHPAPAGGR